MWSIGLNRWLEEPKKPREPYDLTLFPDWLVISLPSCSVLYLFRTDWVLKSNLEELLEIICFKLLFMKNCNIIAFPSLGEKISEVHKSRGSSSIYSFAVYTCFRNAVSFMYCKVRGT